MYVSTAGITGVYILGMLLVRPANVWVGVAVVIAAALATFVATTPVRKSVALAIDYLL